MKRKPTFEADVNVPNKIEKSRSFETDVQTAALTRRGSSNFSLDVDLNADGSAAEHVLAQEGGLVPSWLESASPQEEDPPGPATLAELLQWPEAVHERAVELGWIRGSRLEGDTHVKLTTHYSGAGTAELACRHIQVIAAGPPPHKAKSKSSMMSTQGEQGVCVAAVISKERAGFTVSFTSRTSLLTSLFFC